MTSARNKQLLLLLSSLSLIFTVLLVTRIMAFEQRICAQSSYAPTVNLQFQNITDDVMDVYWVNFDCEEVHYFSLNPGQSLTQPSYITHPWIIRRGYTGEQTACVVTNGAGIVRIGETTTNACLPLNELYE